MANFFEGLGLALGPGGGAAAISQGLRNVEARQDRATARKSRAEDRKYMNEKRTMEMDELRAAKAAREIGREVDKAMVGWWATGDAGPVLRVFNERYPGFENLESTTNEDGTMTVTGTFHGDEIKKTLKPKEFMGMVQMSKDASMFLENERKDRAAKNLATHTAQAQAKAQADAKVQAFDPTKDVWKGGKRISKGVPEAGGGAAGLKQEKFTNKQINDTNKLLFLHFGGKLRDDSLDLSDDNIFSGIKDEKAREDYQNAIGMVGFFLKNKLVSTQNDAFDRAIAMVDSGFKYKLGVFFKQDPDNPEGRIAIDPMTGRELRAVGKGSAKSMQMQAARMRGDDEEPGEDGGRPRNEGTPRSTNDGLGQDRDTIAGKSTAVERGAAIRRAREAGITDPGMPHAPTGVGAKAPSLAPEDSPLAAGRRLGSRVSEAVSGYFTGLSDTGGLPSASPPQSMAARGRQAAEATRRQRQK